MGLQESQEKSANWYGPMTNVTRDKNLSGGGVDHVAYVGHEGAYFQYSINERGENQYADASQTGQYN